MKMLSEKYYFKQRVKQNIEKLITLITFVRNYLNDVNDER